MTIQVNQSTNGLLVRIHERHLGRWPLIEVITIDLLVQPEDTGDVEIKHNRALNITLPSHPVF
jgi:hypothetical protein